jgi:hypothetical protein
MKTLFRNVIDLLAEAALLEEGVRVKPARAAACDPLAESIEENMMEVAFAEAADYDDIHDAILQEHRMHCAAA